MNIARLLCESGDTYAHRPAVTLGTHTQQTYAQLARHSAVMAGQLRALGLQPGDRVAIISANCPEYVQLYFAIWHAGLVVVPVNAKLHASDFSYILKHSGARAVFVSNKLADVVCVVEGPEYRFVIGSEDYQALNQGQPLELVSRAGDEPAWLFYTSGTTGRPKGAMQSHRNLLTMTQCYFSDVDSIQPGDAVFHPAPMSHGGGYYILPHIAHGGVNVVPKSGGFDPEELMALMPHYQQISFFAAPTMVKRLVESAKGNASAFKNLKTIIYGGGPMYQRDLTAAHDLLGYRLAQIYGQGECPMSITALPKYLHADSQQPNYRERMASVGKPMLGIELRLADEQGNEVDPGEPGEIQVRGSAVMLGYFNNPEATEDTIVDGWLRTGDMAKRCGDGFITLVDRAKDVIISGGTNIYPREIEEVLNQHPQVLESSVIGKEDPDWGEIVVAVVVTQPGQLLSEQQLDEYCLDTMARFKRPKHYIFTDQLPKNSTGKILKTELRRQFAASEQENVQ
ncbi:Long-chain-fatty-acid--CoA ligase [Saliniradius amylolyticus]|uniref:Long-chain-fatty-acid--CoA ligase n=1 Tax=Saliniradius amylolyticus TaxID=2183582 RepID=A0A2S2E0K6_9ALTE|nr:AMP-binding protein [Saliniradius amylolyticus]AWL11185.1 Long-chain-fatty-acid--CoA ligase [Saliniradius amylolyticus]